MQTKASLSVLAVAVALPMSVATGFAQIFDNVDSLKNRAVAASPRYLEAHPELLDVPPSAQETDARAARHREQLAKLTKNRALATSPRFLEDHPELLRPQPLVAEAEAKAARIKGAGSQTDGEPRIGGKPTIPRRVSGGCTECNARFSRGRHCQTYGAAQVVIRERYRNRLYEKGRHHC